MIQLNHTNLSVSNVPSVMRFFTSCFGFRVQHTRGEGKLAVLLGKDNFVLTLMHDKNVTDDTYPSLFHVGFLLNTCEAVQQQYEQIVAAGFESPQPALLNRGGPRTFGFYCTPPGGVMVEVSCPAG